MIGSTINDHRGSADALQLAGGGAIEIPVDSTYPFEDYAGALERLQAGAQLGKIVLSR